MRADVCVIAPIHRADDTRIGGKAIPLLLAAGYQVAYLNAEPRVLKLAPESAPRVTQTAALYPKKARLLRWLFTPCLLVQALRTQAKVFYLHNPDTLFLALILSALGKRVIYETHEDYSQRIQMRNSLPRWARVVATKVVCMLESAVYRQVDGFVATQDSVRERLGVKVLVIGNAPWLGGSSSPSQSPSISSEHLRFVYVGGLWKQRGIAHMIRGVKAFKKYLSHTLASQPSAMHIELVIVGPDPDHYMVEACESAGASVDIRYLGPLPFEQAMREIAQSDIGLCLIHDVADHRYTDPNKLYEYVQHGIPFIATNFDKWRGIFPTTLGNFVSLNEEAFEAEFIQATLDCIDKRGSRFVEDSRRFLQQHNWHEVSKPLLAKFRELIA